MAVLIETSLGDLVIDLHYQLTPKITLNFLKLCKMKYYNNSIFYKVQKNFIAQCGNLSKDSSIFGQDLLRLLGGQKYIQEEFHPALKHNKTGQVSMANRGPDMTASHVNFTQFFITLQQNSQELDNVHPVFGSIGQGFEVLTSISSQPVDETKRPYRDIIVKHTYILEDPFEDPLDLIVPPSPPLVTQSERLLPKDVLTDLTPAQKVEKIQQADAQTRAIVLEMIGDLPNAKIKPPENVAFICKLNRITDQDGLFTIFSRFGPIRSCRIVKDWKTGESLGYGFIQFEHKRDCEDAVIMMQGASIDERRVHIDFSQSVSKLWRNSRKVRRRNE